MSKVVSAIATIFFGLWLGYLIVWLSKWFIGLNKEVTIVSIAALFILFLLFLLRMEWKSSEK